MWARGAGAMRARATGGGRQQQHAACSVGWFVLLLVREKILLAGLYERKILFWLEIYDRLGQATAKLSGCWISQT